MAMKWRSTSTAHPAIGDPLAALAEAAGDPDAERWWDDVIEHRGDGTPAFEAVAAAMAAVRGGRDPATLREAQREAHMRQVLRRAIADGHQRIAVVCGAWHVPALADAASRCRGRCPNAARIAKGEGRAQLGAVDPSPTRRVPAATAPGCAARAGTPTCSTIPASRASAAGSSAQLGCSAIVACRRRPTI